MIHCKDGKRQLHQRGTAEGELRGSGSICKAAWGLSFSNLYKSDAGHWRRGPRQRRVVDQEIRCSARRGQGKRSLLLEAINYEVPRFGGEFVPKGQRSCLSCIYEGGWRRNVNPPRAQERGPSLSG